MLERLWVQILRDSANRLSFLGQSLTLSGQPSEAPTFPLGQRVSLPPLKSLL